MRRLGILVTGALVSLALSTSASALAIYSYTGQNFNFFTVDQNPPVGMYTVADGVSGSFDLNAPLGPGFALADIMGLVQAYSFTDGRTTFTQADSSITLFNVATDATGNVSNWSISFSKGVASAVGQQERSLGTQFSSDFGNVSECTVADPSCANLAFDNGLTVALGGQGTWTFVPEPTTALLLATGLVGIAAARRRRSHH